MQLYSNFLAIKIQKNKSVEQNCKQKILIINRILDLYLLLYLALFNNIKYNSIRERENYVFSFVKYFYLNKHMIRKTSIRISADTFLIKISDNILRIFQ